MFRPSQLSLAVAISLAPAMGSAAGDDQPQTAEHQRRGQVSARQGGSHHRDQDGHQQHEADDQERAVAPVLGDQVVIGDVGCGHFSAEQDNLGYPIVIFNSAS